MISIDKLHLGDTFSGALDTKIGKAVPVPGSILETLVSSLGARDIATSIYSGVAFSSRDDAWKETRDAVFKEIAEISESNVNEPYGYSVIQDDYIKSLANLVTNHVSVVRGTVMPEIARLSEEIAEVVNWIDSNDAEELVTLVDVTRPALLESDEVADIVNNYSSIKVNYPLKSLEGFSRLEPKEIMVLCLTGLKDLDNSMIEAVDSLDSDLPRAVYNSLFIEGRTSSLEFITKDSIPVRRFLKAYLGYTMSKTLLEEVDELVKGIDLNTYRGMITSIRDFCGSELKSAYGLLNGTMANLVIYGTEQKKDFGSISGHTKFTMYVDNSLLAKMFDEGLDRLAVYGAALAGSWNMKPEKLLSEAATFVANWKAFAEMTRISKANNKVHFVRAAVQRYFDDSFRDDDALTDIEKDFMVDNPGYKKEVLMRLSNVLDSYSTFGSDEAFVTKVMTEVRFYFTAAKQIVAGMRSANEANPDLTPGQMAMISTVLYLADFFGEQLSPLHNEE